MCTNSSLAWVSVLPVPQCHSAIWDVTVLLLKTSLSAACSTVLMNNNRLGYGADCSLCVLRYCTDIVEGSNCAIPAQFSMVLMAGASAMAHCWLATPGSTHSTRSTQMQKSAGGLH